MAKSYHIRKQLLRCTGTYYEKPKSGNFFGRYLPGQTHNIAASVVMENLRF